MPVHSRRELYERKRWFHMRIIFASNNSHKLSEVKSILGLKYGVFLYSLDDFDIKVDPDENGKSYKENADIKSKAAYAALKEKKVLKLGDYIIADDTGISIDFYNGAPGIYSARFMADLSHKNRNIKILSEMKDVEDEKRKASFETFLSVIEIKIDKDLIDIPKSIIFRSRVDGYIAKELVGSEGFGYDPIFVVKDFMKSDKDFSSTYSKLGQEIKNKVSHRAKAIALFISYLEKNHNI